METRFGQERAIKEIDGRRLILLYEGQHITRLIVIFTVHAPESMTFL
jgi:hypothetical protein